MVGEVEERKSYTSTRNFFLRVQSRVSSTFSGERCRERELEEKAGGEGKKKWR